MHARLVTVRVKRDKLEDAVRVARERMLPAARQQSGFKGGLVLVDEEANKVVGLTLWATEEELLASHGGYFSGEMAKALSLFEEPAVVGHFAVREQLLPGQG